MNKLAYGLLSFLSTESQTGYDLMLQLKRFWHTTHSAIYPLLSELEEKDYIEYTLIEQSSKPDRKVYNITDRGMEALVKWIDSPTGYAVVKDEMMLKLSCIEVLDKKMALKLLDEMENRCEKQLATCNEYLKKFSQYEHIGIESFKTPKFGMFILIKKVISHAESEIDWCKWVKSFYI